jgi:hypothetical protein
MGFDITYSTIERISPALQREILEDVHVLHKQKSWIQCTGPSFENEDGYLCGSSRLTPDRDPRDVATARHLSSGAPDGSVLDLLDVLCKLSRQHDIEWEISHDHSDGVLGRIQCGVADEIVRSTFEGLAAMCEGMGDHLSLDDFDE